MSEVALFIHSTGTGPFMWTSLMAACPEGVQPIAPTNRGYAMNDLLPRGTPFSVEDEVRHLKAQIPADATGVHLMAHSYGGFAALTLAMDASVPVRSLWLYEPVLFGSLHAKAAVAGALPADAAQEVASFFDDPDFIANEERGGSDAWLERFVDYWNQPGMWAAMPDKAKAMARAVGWKMFLEVRSVATEPEPFEHYRLQVPLTLVRGERTTASAREMVNHLAQANPHAQVQTLQGLGHMAVLSAPQQVLPTLTDHWGRAILRA